MPTRPLIGVTSGATIPIGQVCLPVTCSTRENYRTELIDFDVAHIDLPYNAILGYPALAKFMEVTHHAYNCLKLPGCSGTITTRGDEHDAMCSLDSTYKAATAAYPADEDAEEPLPQPAKRKPLFSQERADTKKVSLDASGSGATITIGGDLPPK